MKIKTLGARIKAAGEADGLKPGEFEAIVSAFGNKDAYGDIMVPGAFLQTLSDFANAGDPIPVVWSHDWQDPMSHIGEVLNAAEVPAAKFGPDSPPGLWVHGRNDIEDNARAAQVQRLMLGRRVRQFSFAFEETDSGPGTYNGLDGWLIRGVKLFEVGPTLIGANQSTDLIGAKSSDVSVAQARFTIIDLAARVKAGSRHNAADVASLNDIHAALMDLGVSCGEKHAPADASGTKSDAVPSAEDDKQDRQGSTVESADRKSGGAGSANLRTVVDAASVIANMD
jgi:uncharacterized protein